MAPNTHKSPSPVHPALHPGYQSPSSFSTVQFNDHRFNQSPDAAPNKGGQG